MKSRIAIAAAVSTVILIMTTAAFLAFPQTGDYVDSSLCASCHNSIYNDYQQTGMGRSLYKPNPANSVEDYTTKNAFYHSASDRHYTMIQRDGRYFQRRHQIGPDGRPSNIVEKEVHYVIGSGNHARSYLHLNEQNKLVQLPVTWYSQNGGSWGMSPGYDWKNHQDFRRRITMECMFCHNAYPRAQNRLDRADSEAVFTAPIPEGIDCQRCHGPGADHARTGRPSAIVNPAKLSAERNLEVCMQCHLESTSMPLPYSVRRFGRGVFSYRPGEALSDYMIHFDHAPGGAHDDKFEISSSAYRLRKSLCFEKSAGALTCTTCHNPHNILRGEAATRHYRSVCQNCHQQNSHASESTDCVTCHMPKRRSEDVVQTVMTDHYIQRRKPNRALLAPLTENHGSPYKGEVILYYPKTLPAADLEMYSAVAQVTQSANLQDGIRRLKSAIERRQPDAAQPYFELAKAYVEASAPQLAIPMFRQAIQRMPVFWPAIHRLGLIERSIPRLESAGALSSDGTVLNDLALAYHRAGRRAEAIASLKKAVALDPDLAHAYNNLGGMLWQSGDRTGAEQAFRQSVQAQPDLVAAQANLGGIRVELGDVGQGEYHYRQALKLDPSLVAGHLALGGLLAEQGRTSEALFHFDKAAASANPAERQRALEAIRRLRR